MNDLEFLNLMEHVKDVEVPSKMLENVFNKTSLIEKAKLSPKSVIAMSSLVLIIICLNIFAVKHVLKIKNNQMSPNTESIYFTNNDLYL